MYVMIRSGSPACSGRRRGCCGCGPFLCLLRFRVEGPELATAGGLSGRRQDSYPPLLHVRNRKATDRKAKSNHPGHKPALS